MLGNRVRDDHHVSLRVRRFPAAGEDRGKTFLARRDRRGDRIRDWRAPDRVAIVEGLKSIERDIEADNFVFDEKLEDIHMVIEAELIKRIGEPGRKLHTGRSRNDQVATDLKLWLRESTWAMEEHLRDLQK